MPNYDLWLENQADALYCEPKVIRTEYEYEGPDEPPETVPVYNCDGCDCIDCEHWSDYNY